MRPPIQNISIRFLVLALGLLALSGCSRIDLAYRNLELLLPWYVQSYVELTDRQSALMRTRVKELKRWHCADELPVYAAWVRHVSEDLTQGTTVEQLEARYKEFQAALDRLYTQAAPHLAELLSSASAEQAEAVIASLEKRDEKFRTSWVELSRPELEAKYAEWMGKHLERWLGPLTEAQRQQVNAWSRSLVPTARQTLAYRQRWREALAQALRSGDRPEPLRRQLETLLSHPALLEPPSRAQDMTANRTRTWHLLMEVAATMTAEQRETLRQRTDALSQTLERMSCGQQRSRADAAPPSSG
ncbi:DUF6279 family lipoprotein [Pelomicrobium sp.]|jgi:hypothetical protein|uniref:DUF6279 family lipoprotein n=1 Tax=Pelomicrobium sp. TaxID=2815319 RepID=UPI002FDEF027